MNAFRVWIRPLANVCHVRVDGIHNAQWLLNRLSDSFVFKSSEPLDDNLATACSSFQVQYGPRMSRSMFAKVLAAIPEVTLMSESE